ncbi:ABC transporter ATP-binding protein [Kushneria sp. EE4]
MIQVEALSLTLNTSSRPKTILEDIHLNVASGEAFGLVGESGSGKSSVLKCLAGQFTTWEGRIMLDGQPLNTLSRRARSRQLQMVFQDPYGSLHPRHTIATILEEPLIIQRLPDRRERAIQALEQVGLDADFLSRYPHQISGGQRQRIAIARALVLDPAILLLDEPTSALDVSVQAEILNLLADLRRERALTYLMVSHDLGVVAHLCDRVAVMKSGKLIETVTRDALVNGEVAQDYTRELLGHAHDRDRLSA